MQNDPPPCLSEHLNCAVKALLGQRVHTYAVSHLIYNCPHFLRVLSITWLGLAKKKKSSGLKFNEDADQKCSALELMGFVPKLPLKKSIMTLEA